MANCLEKLPVWTNRPRQASQHNIKTRVACISHTEHYPRTDFGQDPERYQWVTERLIPCHTTVEAEWWDWFSVCKKTELICSLLLDRNTDLIILLDVGLMSSNMINSRGLH